MHVYRYFSTWHSKKKDLYVKVNPSQKVYTKSVNKKSVLYFSFLIGSGGGAARRHGAAGGGANPGDFLLFLLKHYVP